MGKKLKVAGRKRYLEGAGWVSLSVRSVIEMNTLSYMPKLTEGSLQPEIINSTANDKARDMPMGST